MTDEDKKVEQGEKPADQKMVPLHELISVKKKFTDTERALKVQLDDARGQLAQLEAKEKMAEIGGDDDIEVVKKRLIDEHASLVSERAKLEQRVAAITQREKAARAKELVIEYKDKGVSLEVDSLLEADDMEKVALTAYAESLAKVEEKSKKSPSPVFETGRVAVSKKNVWDMTQEEFAKYERDELRKTMLKK